MIASFAFHTDTAWFRHHGRVINTRAEYERHNCQFSVGYQALDHGFSKISYGEQGMLGRLVLLLKPCAT